MFRGLGGNTHTESAPESSGTGVFAMRTSHKVFVALLAVAVVQVVVYYPQLPDRLASHFDGQGRPNGWMSREAFFAIHLGIIAILAVSFLFLPAKLRLFPYRSWSLPNRGYWLSPERIDETMRYLEEQMVWCGAVTAAFMIIVIQLAVEANLNPPPVLSSAVTWLLVGYFVYMGVWLYRLFRHFRLPR